MNDERTEDTDEIAERKELTITIPLDPAHRRFDVALRQQGIDVEQRVAPAAAKSVERALYELAQDAKYGN